MGRAPPDPSGATLRVMRVGPFGQRASKSAEEAQRRARERIAAMTALERALLALRLGRRMRVAAALAHG